MNRRTRARRKPVLRCEYVPFFLLDGSRFQQADHAQRIVLVGGLSGSPYVRAKLAKAFDKEARREYAIPISIPFQFTS